MAETPKRAAGPMRKAPQRPTRPTPKPHHTLPPDLAKRRAEDVGLTRHHLHGHAPNKPVT